VLGFAIRVDVTPRVKSAADEHGHARRADQPVDYLVFSVGMIVRFAAGVLATLLPVRFWTRVNARGIPVYPVVSPLIGLAVGIVVGVPYVYRHLLVSASNAQRMVAIAGSSDQQTAVATAQTFSLFAAVGLVLTPLGFLIDYYTVLRPFDVIVDGRQRIGYPLVRKRDFEIVRKAFRYDVRR